MARFMSLGPVFEFECLTTARRWQVFGVRALFVGALLVSLGVVWASKVAGKVFLSIQAQAQVGESFFMAIVGTELALVCLAAPAAAAGAICQDKARGSLVHLLVTDLSSTEIVLGKLAARLLPTVGWVLAGLPVMALGSLLGGIDPNALFGAFLVILSCAVGGCTVAVVFSVWARKTHEALLATYAVGLVWVLFEPGWEAMNLFWGWGPFRSGPPQWAKASNPFSVAFDPVYRGASAWPWSALVFFGGSMLITAALAALAVWRLRPIVVRQWGHAERASRRLPVAWTRWLPGPSLDTNPVLWREWYRLRPSRWVRLIWGLYAAGGLFLTVVAMTRMATATGPGRQFPVLINGFLIGGGLLLLSVSSATAMAEERSRGSLEVLLATPLSTREIVWGKWLGAFRSVWPLAILPGMLSFDCVFWGGHLAGPFVLIGLVLAYGAAITSLGLALATWLKRLGQIMGISVTAYVLMMVGWIFIVILMLNPTNETAVALAIGSPFYGAIFVTAATMSEPVIGTEFRIALQAGAVWAVLYTMAALWLAWLTLVTFNRATGRMPETRRVHMPAYLRPDRHKLGLENSLSGRSTGA